MKKFVFLKVAVSALFIGMMSSAAQAKFISSILDATAPISAPGVGAALTGTMTERLFRGGSPGGTCDSPKPVSTLPNTIGTFRFDTHTITPTVSGCVTVKSYFAGSGAYQVTAYSSFNPVNVKANFLADSQSSVTSVTTEQFFSFMATAGVSYTLVVWTPTNTAENIPYQIAVGDSLATPGDFDGDGFADISVFRPLTGTWFIMKSSDGTFSGTAFGTNGDVPIDGDFDGDGKTDLCVFRPSSGAWFFRRSYNGADGGVTFGAGNDIPLSGDYDKDGTSDIAVFRPSTGQWFYLRSSQNFSTFTGFPFGQAGDIPIQSQRK